jgi:peptidoglycan/xylan/chitin deacetylase (PgdA/CDA1 family)
MIIKRIFFLCVSIFYYLLRLIADGVFRFFGRPVKKSCVVIAYHSVLANKREQFARQMDELKRLATPIEINQFGLNEEDGNNVLITFDDGYENFFQNALPELVKRKIPSTMFIPAGYIGKRQGWIKNNTHEAFNEKIATVLDLKNARMHAVTIGAHGMWHRNFLNLDEETSYNEMKDSKKILQKSIDAEVDFMAFPYDGYNATIIDSARKIGYKRVFAGYATIGASDKDLFSGRIDVNVNDWMCEFRLKIVGAYNWVHVAVNTKHLLLGARRSSLN